jgi:hypothetical protein
LPWRSAVLAQPRSMVLVMPAASWLAMIWS